MSAPHSASPVCLELDLPGAILVGYRQEHAFMENPPALDASTTWTYC